MLGASVTAPGPPPVSRKIVSKILKASMRRNRPMTASTGLNIGKVSQPIAEHLLGHKELPTGNFLGDFGQKLALSGR
jgi:hypothetical protein